MDMDPELTEAELVILNKIVDDVEKLKQQFKRFAESMAESSRIQASYKAPSMEERLERIMERLAKMTPTPKSESGPELCVSGETDMVSKGTSETIEVDEGSSESELESKADGFHLSPVKAEGSNEDDQVSHDLVVFSTIGANDLSTIIGVAENSNDDSESEIVAVTDTEVISSIVSVEYSSGLVLDHVEMGEGDLGTELCLSNCILDAYLLPVCGNASVYLHTFLLEHMEDDIAEEGEKFDSEPSIVAIKNSENFCIQAVRQNASMVMILYLPPAKPPDYILNGLQDARKTILSYFYMLRDLIRGSRTLWHWSYVHILLVCPPSPPDMTRYLIIFGSVLTGIDIGYNGVWDLMILLLYRELVIIGCVSLLVFVKFRTRITIGYWHYFVEKCSYLGNWNCVNLLLIPGLGLAALPSSSLWRLLIFSVWSSLNINAMQDPNIGVILFCAQNLFEQSDGYCVQPKIKKLQETTAVGARLGMIGENEEEHYIWVSQVSGSFIMATDISCEHLYIGIKIVLFIKDDQHQLESFEERQLEDLIKKHSELIGSYSRICMTSLGSYYHEKRLDFGHNDDLYGDIIVSSLCGIFDYGKPATIEDIVILWKVEKVPVTYHGSSLVVVSNDVTFVKIKVDLCEGEGYLEWISPTVEGLQILLIDENVKGFWVANSQASHNIIWSVASYKFSYENSWLLGIYHWDLIHFWGHFSLLIIKRSRNKLEGEEWIFRPCGLKLAVEKMMELSLEHEQTMFVSSLSYSDVELDDGPEPFWRDPRRLVKVSLLQDSVYAPIFEFVPDALMEPRFVIIVVDIGLCDLGTDIWKEQLNLLNKYKDEVQFISMIIHDTSTDAHVELPMNLYYGTVNKSLCKVKMSQILNTFINARTLDAQSETAGFKQEVFATQVTIWDIAVGFGSPAMNLLYHLSFWFSLPRPPESNEGKSSLSLLERIFAGSFIIAERYNQEVETYFIPYDGAVVGGPWRSNCTDGSCFNNIFLDAFVSSAAYINHIFMFSLPRPPDIVDLEDKVILKEGGMLRIQISRSLWT